MPRARGTDPDAARFGKVLFRLRVRQNWTLLELARYSGMHPDYLGLLERGRNMPSLSTILRIAETFDIPAGRILDEIEKDRPRRRPAVASPSIL